MLAHGRWLTLLLLALSAAPAALAQPGGPAAPPSALASPAGAPARIDGGFQVRAAAPAPLLAPRLSSHEEPPVLGELLAVRGVEGGTEPEAKAKEKGKSHRGIPGLDAERARSLLRSLTVPGWGQAGLGHRHAATVFALAEASVWGSFTAFRIQEKLRTDASLRTASLFAGVHLEGRDEDFRRIVGAFISSEEYNQLVVYRDAANLYYDDPVRYREYIAQHQLTGANAWAWDGESSLQRYRAQRKSAQRASVKANTALAFAIADRLLSALHAARLSNRTEKPRSWNIECAPAGGNDPTAFHLGVRTRF